MISHGLGRIGPPLVAKRAIAGWGIESGEDYVLKKIVKGRGTAEVYRALTLAHKAGLINEGGFLFGSIWRGDDGTLSGETEKDIRKTIRFANELRDKGILDAKIFILKAFGNGRP